MHQVSIDDSYFIGDFYRLCCLFKKKIFQRIAIFKISRIYLQKFAIYVVKIEF